MSSGRKRRLEGRLSASFPPGAVKRHVSPWPLYAAVTGSALAMSTSVPGVRHDRPAPYALSGTARAPLIRAVRSATATPGALLDLDKMTPAAALAPAVNPGGVVPASGIANMIQPGEWVSIYGRNFASGTTVWGGDFPQSLGGVSVTINGRPAYLSMVGPTQINLQAPDDSATGMVSVVVTTSAGRATSTVFLNHASPAFLLLDASHVAAIIVRNNGLGAYGDGLYDILGPTGDCFGYPTMAAAAGDLVELFGVGFGPTNPTVQAGQAYSGVAPITGAFSLNINGVVIQPLFVGLSAAGLYQINFIVPPGLGVGDVPIQAFVDGLATPRKLLSLQGSYAVTVCSIGDGGIGDGGIGVGDGGIGDGGIGDGGIGDGGGGGDGGGDGGGGDGGDGGDGDGG